MTKRRMSTTRLSADHRKMPDRISLGEHVQTTMIAPIHHWQRGDTPNNHGYRSIMGYFLPTWQRGLVWTQSQKVKLIESAWLGLNIGTYTFNRSRTYGGPLDNILIDGQQRMWALECYLRDEFEVFGYRWSELGEADKRSFKMSRHFSSYITSSEDDGYLRQYYNMMNFGGTPHERGEQA